MFSISVIKIIHIISLAYLVTVYVCKYVEIIKGGHIMSKTHKFLLKVGRKVSRRILKRFINSYNYSELNELRVELFDVSAVIDSLCITIKNRMDSLSKGGKSE